MAPYSLTPYYGSLYSDFAHDVLRARSKTPFVSISELDGGDRVINKVRYTYTSRNTNALDLATPNYIYPRTYTYSRPSYLDLIPYRRYYPYATDLAYNLATLIPYYYHPRPVYNNYYQPHYHYSAPQSRTTTTTRYFSNFSNSYPNYYYSNLSPLYHPTYYSSYYNYLY